MTKRLGARVNQRFGRQLQIGIGGGGAGFDRQAQGFGEGGDFRGAVGALVFTGVVDRADGADIGELRRHQLDHRAISRLYVAAGDVRRLFRNSIPPAQICSARMTG